MTAGPLLSIAAVGMLVGAFAARRYPRVWLAVVLGGGLSAAVAACVVLAGADAWEWRGAFAIGGEAPHLLLDGVSAFFLLLLAVAGSAGTLYAAGYWRDRDHPRSAGTGRVWWSAVLLCMGLVLTSANGLHFLIVWEAFTVCVYFLITLERGSRGVRAAGWLYLAASHAGTLCLVALFATLAARLGTWDLGPLTERADLAPLFWLALVGFGMKAGLFPLHIWLPAAHANAPSHVSALLSGVAIKLGIYGLVRFSGWLPVPDGAGFVVAALGVTSAVLGVAFALGQHDIKRLLAYHSVENIGIILAGLGFALVAAGEGDAGWGRLAFAGGLLHVWNHGLFKSLLFFGAGSVLHATGTREMGRLGGLWSRMPWTAGLFALGAAAICGLPPLNGFVSEWLVFSGLFDATLAHGRTAWVSIPAAILLGVAGALALACFVKACGVVFLGAPRSDAALRAHECGPAMRGAMFLPAAACVAIGLAPAAVWPAVACAMGAWRPAWAGAEPPLSLSALGLFHVALALSGAAATWGLVGLVRRRGAVRELTWDCGYAAPTARMQYTAGSFSGIIREWFGWILLPVRHAVLPEGLFPDRARHVEHTPETVLERIVLPAAGLVRLLSDGVRRLQQGRVQAYIAYLVVGVAMLAILVASCT